MTLQEAIKEIITLIDAEIKQEEDNVYFSVTSTLYRLKEKIRNIHKNIL